MRKHLILWLMIEVEYQNNFNFKIILVIPQIMFSLLFEKELSEILSS